MLGARRLHSKRTHPPQVKSATGGTAAKLRLKWVTYKSMTLTSFDLPADEAAFVAVLSFAQQSFRSVDALIFVAVIELTTS